MPRQKLNLIGMTMRLPALVACSGSSGAGATDGSGARLGTFIWEPTEYHERVFAPSGNVIEDMIAPYDQMKIDYQGF